MAGPKTLLQEELRHLGGTREGVHAQRFQPPVAGARPIAKTLVAGEAPPTTPAPAARAHVEAVRIGRALAEERAQKDRLSLSNIERASRAFRDAGLSYRALDRAMDLYTEHGTAPEAAIAAVGGRRMSVEAARAIESALVPPNNPNDDRAYFHALDLHAGGLPLPVAIAQARAEDVQERARRQALRVQEYPAPVRIPPPPPPRAPRRLADYQTPSQRAQNAADNRHAAAGIGVLLVALAAVAALVFGKSDPPAPAQPRQPVKPPAPPPQPPTSQPKPPVKGRASPWRR